MPLPAWSSVPQKPPDKQVSIGMVHICLSVGVEACEFRKLGDALAIGMMPSPGIVSCHEHILRSWELLDNIYELSLLVPLHLPLLTKQIGTY